MHIKRNETVYLHIFISIFYMKNELLNIIGSSFKIRITIYIGSA